jgi:hypothetical protein
MDEEQQKQVNEAAEKFADALKQSYQSLASLWRTGPSRRRSATRS